MKNDYDGDEWMQPPASSETKTRRFNDTDTRVPRQRPRKQEPPQFPENQFCGLTLGRNLGAGSHGWVFEAQRPDKEVVALKILPNPCRKASVRAKAGFRRMVDVEHQSLMNLYQMHLRQGYLAFEMEHIGGSNLDAVFRKWRPLPFERGCERLTEMVRQIAAGIAEMHSHQLVHRDVKPSNLMMTQDGCRFVLVDFDLVSSFDPELDCDGIRDYLVWTPRYVAPEVLSRQTYVPASDIFSLGMVLLQGLRIISSGLEDSQSSRASSKSRRKEPVHPRSDADAIRRDQDSVEHDRVLIEGALKGLHPRVPRFLVETLNEMLAATPADRPMAVSLTRLGKTPNTLSMHPPDSVSPPASRRMDAHIASRFKGPLETIDKWIAEVLDGGVSRLHLQGQASTGKSAVLGVTLQRLRVMSWSQCFSAKCIVDEEACKTPVEPFGSFQSIIDDVIGRYGRRDREAVEVTPETRSRLLHHLPSLGLILKKPKSASPAVDSIGDPDRFQHALVQLFNAIRQFGPVFLAFDRTCQADVETFGMLDRLRREATGNQGPDGLPGLGIITVSRINEQPQCTPADRIITLPSDTDAKDGTSGTDPDWPVA
ncbi:MAG: protein kinase [Planctomycetota bacterium]